VDWTLAIVIAGMAAISLTNWPFRQRAAKRWMSLWLGLGLLSGVLQRLASFETGLSGSLLFLFQTICLAIALYYFVQANTRDDYR